VSSPTPIALCITDLDPGGAEKALVQVVTRLDRTQWAPVVYCLGPRAELADVLEAAGIETHCLNARRRDVSVVLRLARLLKRQRPALIQTFLFHANIAGRFAARIAKVPVVVSGIRVAERQKDWHLWLEWLTKRFVTHHVAVSHSVAEFTSRELRLAKDRVSVIRNGVDGRLFANASPADLGQFSIPPTASTLLFVGRLHVQKGVSDLLEAMWELVDEEKRDVHLLIVGEGPEQEKLQASVRWTPFAERVHWLGHRRDVASLMKASTLLVLPSLWEGMPNVVLEAMAAGLPVVATDVDGSAELVKDGETGWLCNAGHFQSATEVTHSPRNAGLPSLAGALGDALDFPRERRELANAAQALVQKGFTWDDVSRSYDALWRQLLTPAR